MFALILLVAGCSSTIENPQPVAPLDHVGEEQDYERSAEPNPVDEIENDVDLDTEAIMPDVTCMDLQAAQDEIQEAGVFYSRSVDATGEGRRQMWDRNWVVVDQTPSAGSPIGEGEAILSVVKDGEPGSC